MIPSILEKEQLADANGLIQLTSSLAQALSNALGGALVVAVGAILAIGLNSVTFLVSGLLIATLATRKPHTTEEAAKNPEKPKVGFMEDTHEGLRYLVANRPLLLLTISAGVFNFFFGMILPFFVIYTEELLHGDATTYGIFLGLFSLGAAPGSLLVARIGAVRRAGLTWTIAGVVGGILLLVLVPRPGHVGGLLCDLHLWGVHGLRRHDVGVDRADHRPKRDAGPLLRDRPAWKLRCHPGRADSRRPRHRGPRPIVELWDCERRNPDQLAGVLGVCRPPEARFHC